MAYLSLLLSFAFALTPLVENGDAVPVADPVNLSIAWLHFPNSRCSATFISPRVLLTAGHCVDNQSSVFVKVRDARGRWVSRGSQRLVLHPGYAIRRAPGGHHVFNDYGLVILSSPIAGTKALEIFDPRAMPGTFEVTVAGFGRRGRGQSTDRLRQGTMNATVRTMPYFGDVPGLYMTATSRAQATCGGDSGGPVFVTVRGAKRYVGVHSLSTGCQGDPPAESYSAIPANVAAWIARYL
ncbi:MAG TPA: S1 family peptidase [Bdellovibrionales bacterium]|nr:S1 family peptidase [Bdellovibrionales bacterium]